LRTPQGPGAALHTPASGETGLIHLQEVVAGYGGRPVLGGFTLLVQAGEFVSVLGQSGAGKTTALRVIAGFEKVTGGYVRIGGQLVGSSFVHVPADRRRVGVVFQDYALFPHLTVADNVAFGLQGVPRKEREERVRPVIEMAGLAAFERRYPHELSGGQQQRVALARALAPGPVALLLDEPFSNLDRELRAALRREVRSIVKAAGATAVLVTHDREEALGMADIVAVMGRGRVEQAGRPEDVYRAPVSVDVARLVSPCDVLPGVMRGGRVATEAGDFPVQPEAHVKDGDRVLAVLRAPELAIVPAASGAAAGQVAYREFRGEVTEYGVRFPSGQVVRVRQRSSEGSETGGQVAVAMRAGSAAIVFPDR
jgi:ABC-type Fe3+/spermidine/putrescine transport system ATPase subunit